MAEQWDSKAGFPSYPTTNDSLAISREGRLSLVAPACRHIRVWSLKFPNKQLNSCISGYCSFVAVLFFPEIFCFFCFSFIFLQLVKDFCLIRSLQLPSAASEQGGKTPQVSPGIQKRASDGEVLKQKKGSTPCQSLMEESAACTGHCSFPSVSEILLPNYKNPRDLNRHVFHHYQLNLVKNSTSHICFCSQRVVWCCRSETWVRTPGRNLLRPAGAPEGTLPI